MCMYIHQQQCAGPNTQPTSLPQVPFIKGSTNLCCEQQKIVYLFFAESISNVDLLRCFRCLIMLGMSIWDNNKKFNAQHVCWQSSAFASWNTYNNITGTYLWKLHIKQEQKMVNPLTFKSIRRYLDGCCFMNNTPGILHPENFCCPF